MARFLLLGLWLCIVVLSSGYGAAYWAVGPEKKKQEEPYLEGTEFRKLRVLNVPVISDGEVKGYVIAQFVFTADARTLREMPIPPEAVILDKAFRIIYDDMDANAQTVGKKDIDSITEKIKTEANNTFGSDLVKSVLVEEFNYISKENIK